MEFKKFIIITGHYGCGKTNFAVNLALHFINQKKSVTLADLDIVNPYFRSSDYAALLEGAEIIAPNFAGSTLDVPSLSPKLDSLSLSKSDYVIIDAGGDDAGAVALSRYASVFPSENTETLYLINENRSLTNTPQDAVLILREIENVSGLKADYLINNTHLSGETDENTILSGERFAKDVAKLTGLTLKLCCIPETLSLRFSGPDYFPVKRYVTTVWDK